MESCGAAVKSFEIFPRSNKQNFYYRSIDRSFAIFTSLKNLRKLHVETRGWAGTREKPPIDCSSFVALHYERLDVIQTPTLDATRMEITDHNT